MTSPTLKLCYVSGGTAYFTELPLDKQWGDDWDDAPYEHNAGEPYPDRVVDGQHVGHVVRRLMFSAEIETPADSAGRNSRYSVQAINAGAIAWLTSPSWAKECVVIQAGASPAEFIVAIRRAGGEVYVPVGVEPFWGEV